MADPTGITPPYLDPSQYPDYADMQKKQMMASMLMNSLQNQQSQPATPGPSGLAIVPKRGWAQNLSPLVTALMAGKAQNNSIQAQQKYFTGLMSPQQPQQPQTPQDPTSAALSQFPAAPPSGARASPGVLPQATSQPPGGVPQQAQQSGNPMLLTGEPRTSNMLLGMMGQQEYGKALAGRYAPTDMEKMLRAAGIDPASPQGSYALRQAVNKAGYIEPIGGARPGTIAFDPVTHQPMFAQPDITHNAQLTPDGKGGVTAAPIPGNAAAQGQLAGAEAGAKAANTLETLPTQGGGSRIGWAANLAGPPPGLGGAAPGRQGVVPSGPQGPQSSPQSAQSGLGDIPKLQIGTGLGAPDEFTKGVLNAAGQRHAELSGELGKEASLADQQLEYSREARAALPNAETGPLSEWLTRNRASLTELGVPSALIPGNGSVVPTLELNKALKNAALQGARQIYGPRMTQTEVKLQTEEMSPSSSMMRDAISSLMRQNDIRAMYSKARAEDYRQFRTQGGDPFQFESWYATRFPLRKFAQEMDKAQVAK